MDINKYKIVLASSSPRRRELLSQVGVEYEVIPSECEEIITSVIPSEVVLQLSKDKAADVAKNVQTGTIVIGADTVVASDGRILGKPSDEKDAFNMISSLRNRHHSVYTGVTIIYHDADGDIVRTFYNETKVFVYDMSDDEIWEYIATGEPMDKAGAYGIQGRFASYIKGIEGDYNNVVGLPVSHLLQEIRKMEV